MFRAFPLSTVALLLVTAPTVQAQVDPMDSLVAGTKVKVTLKVRQSNKAITYSGSWVGTDEDSLRVKLSGAERGFPLRDVARLDRAAGKKGAWGAVRPSGRLLEGLPSEWPQGAKTAI